MKIQKSKIAIAFALIMTAALAVGCGQTAYSEGDDDDIYNPGGGNGGTGGSSSIPPWTPSVVVTDTNASPTSTYRVKLTGNGSGVNMNAGTPMVVSADSKLKISLTAGSGLPFSGGNWSVGFNCEQFTVTVGNISKTAFVKKANYYSKYIGVVGYDPCRDAPTTWTGDFSAATGVGQGNKTIVISGGKYDNCRKQRVNHPYYCAYYGCYLLDPESGGCDMTDLYNANEGKHSVDVNVAVYSD